MIERVSTWAAEARQDVTFALRTLVLTPGFVAASVTLGAAAGAVVAVYGTVDWLLDRPPTGVVEPHRIVDLHLGEIGRPELSEYGFSYPQYVALEASQDAFSDVAAYAKVPRMIGAVGRPYEEVVTQWVSGSYFPLLGVEPHVGRLFTVEDDVDGAPAIAVVSHAYWQTRLGGTPDALGKTLRFGPDPVTVVGVLPAGFEDFRLDWNGPTDVWFPMRAAQSLYRMPGMLTMTQTFFRILGRLPEGRSLEQAREMAQRWIPELPELTTPLFEPNLIGLRPAISTRVTRREEARGFLGALLVVCGLVLLAAAANVVNYLLGRIERRRRELALRAALGAGRARLVRQLVAEVALLATATAGVSVLTGWMVTTWLAPLPATYLDLTFRTGVVSTAGALDGRLLGLAVAAGYAVTMLLGTVPALGTFHDPAQSLRGGAPRWGWSRFRLSTRQIVLVSQIAFAVLLAASATLLGRSFARALALPPDYVEPESILLARVQPVTLPEEEARGFLTALLARLEEEPGVRAVTVSWNPPYAGARSGFSLPESSDRPVTVLGATGGPRYFAVLGTPVVAGEDFGAMDDPTGAESIIVNQSFAERFWPGQESVGRTILLNGEPKRIRGIVGRHRCGSELDAPTPCFWSWAGADRAGPRVYRVRTEDDAEGFAARFREIVAELNPDVAVTSVESLESFLAYRLRGERLAALASVGLALFGILLLAAGCAAVFVSMVRQSARELAIRVALGATNGRLTARIVTHGALLLSAGIVLGLSAARLVAPRFGDRLFQVAPDDPLSYGIAAAAIAGVGLAAVAASTRAAVGQDPSPHLRSE